MYLIAVILLLFIFPAASVLIDMLRAGSGADWMLLVGKWFVFWAVGVRLFIAGLRQVFQPQFTAETIFEIKDESRLCGRARSRLRQHFYRRVGAVEPRGLLAGSCRLQ